MMNPLSQHTTNDSSWTANQRAFSLVEMLFAIFILAIGVISISALFPVGLTQQQRSADAIIGPTIANNALSILRSKISSDDFGWLNTDPSNQQTFDDPYITLAGDFRWKRPAFYLQDTPSVTDQFGNNQVIPAGSIDIFHGLQDAYQRPLSGTRADTVTEVPYNRVRYPDAGGNPQPPRVIITQQERFYPQLTLNDQSLPRYTWDCAFRRFQGRMQVAIFVYRLQPSGGNPSQWYRVNFLNPNVPNDPPMPHFNLLDGNDPNTGADDPWFSDFDGDGISGTIRDIEVPNTDEGDPLDAQDFDFGWQFPGQWVLDQNNNIHRISSGRRDMTDGPVRLNRPVPDIPVYGLANNRFAGPFATTSHIGGAGEPTFELWYVPPVVNDPATGQEWRLLPVYVTVRDL